MNMDDEVEASCSLGISRTEPDSSWTIAQLRDYLRKCGGRLSGRKSDLIER